MSGLLAATGALTLMAGFVVVGTAGTAQAEPPADPPGNNGTLKVHEEGTPSGTEDTDPKVCSFNIEGFDFDAGQQLTISFAPQGGSEPVGTASGPHGPYTADQAGSFATGYFSLAEGTYKTTAYGKDAQGAYSVDLKAKSKVFKVICGSGGYDECPDLDGDQPKGFECTKPPTDRPVTDKRFDCTLGYQTRSGTVTTTYAFDAKTQSWAGTDGAPVWGDWVTQRPLTPDERIELKCDTPVTPPPPPPVTDVCTNIDGVQQDVPKGYTLVDGLCVKEQPAPTETAKPEPTETAKPEPKPTEPARPIVGPGGPAAAPGAVPTVVDAGLVAPTSAATSASLLGQGLVGAGLLMLILAGSMQLGRRERGGHEA